MRRTALFLLSLAATSFLPAAPLRLNAQVQQSTAKADTLPAAVVQRALDAFNRRDVNGVKAAYDSVYTHENLGNGNGPSRVTRAAMLDSLVGYYKEVKDANAKLAKRIIDGPFVVDLYEGVQSGAPYKHLDIYEVRRGKIVREWEY